MASLCNTSMEFSSDEINLLAISAMASSLILVVAYIVYKIWGDEKIKIWVKQELWNLVLNGIVIVVLMGFISWFQSSLTSAQSIDSFIHSILPSSTSLSGNVEGDCLYAVSYDYSLTLMATTLEEYAVNSWSYVHLDYLTKVSKTVCSSSSFIICLLGAPSVFTSPFSYLTWLIWFFSTMSRTIFSTVLLFGFSQGVLIKLFVSSHFFKFLALMLIMRLIPFTRTFANVLFAMIFSFMIFYPMLVVLEYYILGVPAPSDDSISASITDASKLASLQYTLPQDELLQKDVSDLWKMETYNGDLVLEKSDKNVIINISKIIYDYAKFLFTIVLFGSVNLIVVSLALKSLLKYSGESNNLMEMFIRMSGIITW